MNSNHIDSNIFPIYEHLLQRSDREQLLGQRAQVLWLTGLSGSGKSTIAIQLERRLHEQGVLCMVLDGDNLRAGLNSNLGFSDTDRSENLRRVAEVARLFLQCGVVLICTFVSPTIAQREQVRTLIGADDFKEIYINAPLEECEKRDVKGLYAKARSGQIPNFTGIHQPYEAPESPFLEVRTDQLSVQESVNKIINAISLS